MIRLLPPEVASRIAAGEVVERPASVVRELVDNSIDAGAKRILVDVEAGGTEGIRVTDDGCGMDRDDAMLCMRRHATSKITSADDLERIQTKGFRGEALASIASVSDFELVTRRPEDSSGFRVTSEGGDAVNIEETGTPVGTRVTVKNLFGKVPARKKFLKRPSTELQHVTNTVVWAALAHENIHFALMHNGRTVLELPSVADRWQRLRQHLGEKTVEGLVPVSFEHPELSISGFISRPAFNRNNAQHVMFFVNDRLVRDRLLHRAAMDGYRNMLPNGRYPAVYLFLDVPLDAVDINVHPTKQEVRFAEEQKIFGAVYAAIKSTWEQNVTARAEEETKPDVDSSPSQKSISERPGADVPSQTSFRMEPAPPHKADGHAVADRLLKPPVPHRPFVKQDRWHDGTPASLPPMGQTSQIHTQARPPEAAEKTDTIPPESGAPKQETLSSDSDLLKGLAPASVDSQADIQVIGQLLDSYILAQAPNGLIVIDQHAAHERIRFEEVYAQWKKRQVVAQALLIPLTVDLSATEMALSIEHRETLLSFGLDVEPFGSNTVSVRALPQGVEFDAGESLLRDVLNSLTGNPAVDGTGEDQRAVHALYTVACRSAIKFGDRLSLEDMQALIKKLRTVPRRDVCPHGRPAILSLKESDLRRAFERG